jgi:hypothetical protein
MMIRPGDLAAQIPADTGQSSESIALELHWAELYGPTIAAQLEADRRYSLIAVGAVQFAYSDFGLYLRALGQTWDGGFVPEPMPSAPGRDLPEVAPNLQGVDAELGALTEADVAPPLRRFGPRST